MMRNLLSVLLCLHWAVVFAVMAAVCLPGENAMSAAIFGVALPMPVGASGMAVSTILALAFSLAGALQLSAMLAAGIGDGEGADDVLRLAYTVGCLVLTLLLLAGLADPASGLMPAVAAHQAALLASWLAVRTERQAATAADPDLGRAAARTIAASAACGSVLARIAGRAPSRQEPR